MLDFCIKWHFNRRGHHHFFYQMMALSISEREAVGRLSVNKRIPYKNIASILLEHTMIIQSNIKRYIYINYLYIYIIFSYFSFLTTWNSSRSHTYSKLKSLPLFSRKIPVLSIIIWKVGAYFLYHCLFIFRDSSASINDTRSYLGSGEKKTDRKFQPERSELEGNHKSVS